MTDQIVRPMGPVQEQEPSKLEAYSSVISWGVYGLAGLLVAAVIAMGVSSHLEKERRKNVQSSWDKIYLAFKDKKELTHQDRIKILEGLWEDKEISGSEAHPSLAMELAQLHFEMGLRPERRPAARMESLKKSKAIYDTVLKQKAWADNPLYGPLAAEGSALAAEQSGDLDEAAKILNDAVRKYEQHFLFPKLCYQLGRVYWLRSRNSKADPEAVKKDKAEALRRLGQATLAKAEPGGYPPQWREEAEFLKVLLQKPGAAMPDTVPPPITPKPEARKIDVKDVKKVEKQGEGAAKPKKDAVEDAGTSDAGTGEVEKPSEKTEADQNVEGAKETEKPAQPKTDAAVKEKPEGEKTEGDSGAK